jgi:hypothetical protein
MYAGIRLSCSNLLRRISIDVGRGLQPVGSIGLVDKEDLSPAPTSTNRLPSP